MFWHLYDAWVRPDLVVGIHTLVALIASCHAVMTKEEPRSATGWVGLIWLSPLIGALLYYIFGINRIRRSAVTLMGAEGKVRLDRATAGSLHAAGLLADAGLQQLSRLGDQVSGMQLTPGNAIDPLLNGEQAYPAMLQAIAEATSSVMLSSYIFDYDAVGREFIEALRLAVLRGVEVRVLIDATGSRYSFPSVVPKLRAAGVRSARFMPNLQPTRIAALNLRSHRKIMVVDGRIGFTGGMNIRQGNYVTRGYPHPVQDLHFKIVGPVVAHLRQAFIEDWAFTTKEVLAGDQWLPHIEPGRGDVLARGVPDGPDRDFEKVLWTMLGAISSARTRIRIATPYFLPDSTAVRFLSVALMSGVQVEILLPEKNNIPPVAWAAFATLPPLLQKNCKVYLVPPPFDHTKMMLIDDAWALIGSANWDARSLRLNFEFNIECFSRDLADRLHLVFDDKLRRSRPLTLEDLSSRSFPVRLRDSVTRLFAPYL
ncbi:MAG: phospholipase D-like domain-containing protein [Proteobacteria bacterium]|nr:phospholipase D-like domain-containing protein [Pseudomonadota bacterium]